MANVCMPLWSSVSLIQGRLPDGSVVSRAPSPIRAIKQDMGFVLKPGVLRSFHELPSGQRMEVLSATAGSPVSRKSTPLVFLHGSYHAAWCWAEHWLPYFSQAGYDCFALSLLGQGESDLPPDQVPRTLELHANDVAHFIERQVEAASAPVLVGHSFGGLVVQFYLSSLDRAENQRYPSLSAAVLVCSVPPTGNTAVVMRFLRTRPLASLKVTYSLAAKGFARSLSLCRETFFSPDMSDADVQRYQTLIKQSSVVPLFDLKKLNASLPVRKPPSSAPPVLVIGSENDFILDKQALDETAAYYNAKQVILPDTAHDIMLDTHWEKAAEVVESWLSSMKEHHH